MSKVGEADMDAEYDKWFWKRRENNQEGFQGSNCWKRVITLYNILINMVGL